ncbi:MAG: PAC2 family protein, partial [Pseudomonadota bacterium]
MGSSAFEAFLTIQCIMAIAALGHYLPLSMKQLDVGIAGYMAIGAYTSAILTRDHGMPFAVALAAGAALAAVGALVIDSLATRVKLSGFAYAIFSLSFAESLRIILNNSQSVGGTLGFVGIPSHTTLGVAAGILAALGERLGGVGVPTIGLWARVPHYAAGLPYPDGSLQLLQGL